MIEEYGRLQEPRHDRETESLDMSFWPGSVPLKQRWRNNGLSADFLGDYVTTFFPLEENDPATRARRNEVHGVVAFIANELLENAMKFHDGTLPEPIRVRLELRRDSIVLQQSNAVGAEEAERLRVFVKQLRASDPAELYIQQIEANAVSDRTAGMGYLTMINDYEAELAWRFESLATAGIRVTTQVTIGI